MKAIRRLATTDYGDVVQLKGEDLIDTPQSPTPWRRSGGSTSVSFFTSPAKAET
jgi:hypothetical protein